jgi:hypothetical protein
MEFAVPGGANSTPITAHGSSGCYTDNEKPFVFGIIKALLEKKNFIYEQK